MERINGYIDLSKEISFAKKKNPQNLIETNRCSTNAYWIKNMNSKNYLFKVTDKNQEYRSLLIEEMAKLAQIPVPHTDIAVLGYYRGELIEDYRKPNYQYTPGSTILYEYFLTLKDTEAIQSIIPRYLIKEDLTDEKIDELLKRLNNLETIWNALELHYRKYSKREEIVANIMKKLANRFAFDFITMQQDRHSSNWEVEENGEEADLTPLYDSNRSFYYPSFNLEFHVQENFKFSEIYEELEYYLTYSDSSFTIYFYELYEIFTLETIEKLLQNIELKIHKKIPEYVKNEILSSYQEHRLRLEEIVERRNQKR